MDGRSAFDAQNVPMWRDALNASDGIPAPTNHSARMRDASIWTDISIQVTNERPRLRDAARSRLFAVDVVWLTH